MLVLGRETETKSDMMLKVECYKYWMMVVLLIFCLDVMNWNLFLIWKTVMYWILMCCLSKMLAWFHGYFIWPASGWDYFLLAVSKSNELQGFLHSPTPRRKNSVKFSLVYHG